MFGPSISVGAAERQESNKSYYAKDAIQKPVTTAII